MLFRADKILEQNQMNEMHNTSSSSYQSICLIKFNVKINNNDNNISNNSNNKYDQLNK